MVDHSRLDGVLAKTAKSGEITGVVARVEDPESGLEWSGAIGDLAVDTPFFIASTTKLYTTAIVLRLVEQGKLDLADRLVDLVDGVEGLHTHQGTDHTPQITVRHLLSHTSGLPDYFQGRQPDGSTLEEWLRAGNDRAWGLDYVLEAARAIGPEFPPGTARKALYSDTNFQLLGEIIEVTDGRPYAAAIEHHIVGPLGLGDTWLYADPADTRPAPLRDGPKPFPIPKAMTSFGPDGGVVATVSDLMVFLRAFFEGRLFSRDFLAALMDFNRIFFPLQYGVGIARFRLPRVLSPLSAPPDLIGHSGLSGAFAFVERDTGTYLAGTVNNVDSPDRSFRMMLGLLRNTGT